MQFKFLTTLLLVAVCFAQVTFAHPHETAAQRSLIDDLIAQAKKAIEKIQSIIKSSIDDALKAFDKFKDQVSDLAQGAIDDASGTIKDIIAGAQKQIEDIKHKAEEAGKDISACLSNVDDRFQGLFNDFVSNVTACVTNEVDGATTIINNATQIIVDAWKTVEDLPEKLQACGTGLSSITCINKVIVEVAKLQIDLPGKIAKEITEVSAYVAGLKARLATCAVSQVANAGFDAAGIVADVVSCAGASTENPGENSTTENPGENPTTENPGENPTTENPGGNPTTENPGENPSTIISEF